MPRARASDPFPSVTKGFFFYPVVYECARFFAHVQGVRGLVVSRCELVRKRDRKKKVTLSGYIVETARDREKMNGTNFVEREISHEKDSHVFFCISRRFVLGAVRRISFLSKFLFFKCFFQLSSGLNNAKYDNISGDFSIGNLTLYKISPMHL